MIRLLPLLATGLILGSALTGLTGCDDQSQKDKTAGDTTAAAVAPSQSSPFKSAQDKQAKSTNTTTSATADDYIPDADTLVNDEPFLNIKEIQTDSGITAWLVEDHSLPLITVSFAFEGAGAVNDPVDKQGLARMVSNTLDEGAGDLDSQAFRKLLSDNSISLGFSSGRDNFSGSLYTLTDRQELAFDLLHKALTVPRFDQEPVDRMRAANIARIKSSLTDPSWLAARLVNDVVFDGHPYEHNSGGTLTTLQTITPDDLRDFTNAYLTRDRLKIAVVGDIDADSLAPILDRVFGDLPETGPRTTVPDTAVRNKGQTVLHETDIPQTMIRVMQPGVSRQHPAYHDFQVMNFILGGSGFGSRLMEDAREDRGLTYGIYSSLFMLDHAHGLLISTSTGNNNVEEMRSIIQTELATMKTQPVKPLELKRAQSYLIGSMPLSLTSSRGIAGMLLSLQLDDLPPTYLNTVDNKIAGVTIDSISDIAGTVLDPAASVTVLVGQPELENTADLRIVEELPNVE